MPAFLRSFVVTFCLCCFASTGWSVQVTVPLTQTSPVIDGSITASEKQNSVSVDLTKVGGLDKPRLATKAYLAATYEGFYVGFVANDPDSEKLVTSITTENEAVFNDESVQIFISPTIETAADSYYHFAVNADGVRYSNYLLTRDTVNDWQTSVTRGKGHWQAEFFIPLNTIKASDELPYWRANFARFKPATDNAPEETSAWVNPGFSLHNYKKFGYMTMPRFVPPAPGSTAPNTTAGASQTTGSTSH